VESGLSDAEVLTHLQMCSAKDLIPASASTVPIEVFEAEPSSPLIRGTTLAIGRAYQWPSQHWDDQQWLRYLARPYLRHWIATVDGVPAGLLSLDVQPDGQVELDTFGLLPAHLGRGTGGQFLTVGVRLAWTAAPVVSRVWLHTSSRDHPHALPNYERRGFRRFLFEEGPSRQL
jgi:GNAT superfamily N-acetyltransferase